MKRFYLGLTAALVVPLAWAQKEAITPAVKGRAPTATVTVDKAELITGETVTATATFADADGDAQQASAWRWLLNGNEIAGATNDSYTLPSSAVNSRLEAEVTVATDPLATDPATGTATSASIAANKGSAPVASALTISGVTKEGQTLTGSFTYSDADGDVAGAHAYQWYQSDNAAGTTNKTALSGATTTTYVQKSGQVGKYLVFEVIPKSVTGAPDTGAAATAVSTVVTADLVATGSLEFSAPITLAEANAQGISYFGTYYDTGTQTTYVMFEWTQANAFCNAYAGHGSAAGVWRLPSKAEFDQLHAAYPNGSISSGKGWPSSTRYFWTSTLFSAGRYNNFHMANGNSWNQPQTGYGEALACVRG